ncbi:MAG: type II secretion system protein [Clostridiaceae bacterium]|nr:type II secretion system protein [Clostridiaceae bacterium]
MQIDRSLKYIKIKIKKGWTLIENIVVIGIFLLLAGSILISAEQVVIHENTLEVEGCKTNILTFINKSRLYCRNKFKGGDIIFDTINNKIVFKIGTNYIDKILLPRDFKLKDIIVHDGYNCISIDKYGFISNACTISFLDKFKNKSELTICVGTGYLEIK